MGPVASKRLFWALSAAAILALALAATWRYLGFIVDDTAIGYRIVERILDGKGYTWTDNDRTDATTGQLWIIAHTLAGLLHIDLVVFTRIYGLLGALLCGLAVQFLALRRGVARSFALLLGALTASTAPISLWAAGGIDVPVLAGSVAWISVLSVLYVEHRNPRHLRIASWFGVALTLTRIDGIMLLGVAAASLFLLCPGSRFRSALRLALPGTLALGAVTLIRFRWTGSWVPNTAANKLYMSLTALDAGLGYLRSALTWIAPLLTVVALAAALRRIARPMNTPVTATVPGILLASWIGYVALIGGDWMPGFRHLALVPVLLVLCALSLLTERRTNLLAGLLTAALAVTVMVSHTSEGVSRALRLEDSYPSCVAVSEVLTAAFKELDPFMAVEPAGCVPWRTGFRALDMLGGFDAHISNRPADLPVVSWTEWESRWTPDGAPRDVVMVAHDNGDGRYVWEREPDFFVLCNSAIRGAQGCFQSWLYIEDNYDVTSRYVEIEVADRASPTGSSWFWVRHTGGATGVRTQNGAVLVPAYLFASADRGVVSARAGNAVTTIRPGSAPSPLLDLQAGMWSLAGVPPSVSVGSSRPCATVQQTGTTLTVSVREGCQFSLVLSAARSTELPDLTLTRA